VEYDWSQAQVTGFEQTDSSDLGIPFLIILQKGNPEVDKANPQYAQKKIPGAEVGDIANTLSREVVYKYGGDPMIFIPCFHQKAYVEWRPRDTGGGIVNTHLDEGVLQGTKRNEKNQDVLPNGNIIVTTSYFFGIIPGSDDNKKAVISLTSTQLKKSRSWLNVMMNLKFTGPRGRYTPPMFSHQYAISTDPESNAKGSWMGWKIELGDPVKTMTLIQESQEFAQQIAAGKQRLALPPAQEDDIPVDSAASKM
jgi:hypothetical protein